MLLKKQFILLVFSSFYSLLLKIIVTSFRLINAAFCGPRSESNTRSRSQPAAKVLNWKQMRLMRNEPINPARKKNLAPSPAPALARNANCDSSRRKRRGQKLIVKMVAREDNSWCPRNNPDLHINKMRSACAERRARQSSGSTLADGRGLLDILDLSRTAAGKSPWAPAVTASECYRYNYRRLRVEVCASSCIIVSRICTRKLDKCALSGTTWNFSRPLIFIIRDRASAYFSASF